ncbi:MAG: hypothetical protein ACREQ8_07510 [Woeseiaceae bacterium]
MRSLNMCSRITLDENVEGEGCLEIDWNDHFRGQQRERFALAPGPSGRKRSALDGPFVETKEWVLG